MIRTAQRHDYIELDLHYFYGPIKVCWFNEPAFAAGQSPNLKKKNASREETEQGLRKQNKKQNSNNDNNNKKLRQFNISRNTRKGFPTVAKTSFPTLLRGS